MMMRITWIKFLDVESLATQRVKYSSSSPCLGRVNTCHQAIGCSPRGTLYAAHTSGIGVSGRHFFLCLEAIPCHSPSVHAVPAPGPLVRINQQDPSYFTWPKTYPYNIWNPRASLSSTTAPIREQTRAAAEIRQQKSHHWHQPGGLPHHQSQCSVCCAQSPTDTRHASILKPSSKSNASGLFWLILSSIHDKQCQYPSQATSR